MEARQTPAVIRREDYAPYSWTIQKTSLDIQLFDDRAVICATLDIAPNPHAQPSDILVLNGEHQQLISVAVDGEAIDAACYQLEEGKLSISGLKDTHQIAVTSAHNPYENTALEGLYASGGMLCTQCEPEGFRRICFYPDRPDVMSIFTVRIEADIAFPNLLSNGNLLESGASQPGRHYAVWHDPHKKPAYLFALVAGDLEQVSDGFVTASGRKVDLHIYVEKGNAALTGHAMDSLKRSMKWDEDVYGLEYDLDLFQIVAVSHFNMGAMENKGLNIFNSKFVLADALTATDDDLDRVEAIIAHEYFHNWTGNRVTCRDWFQLTLKEGLTVFRDQSFSADMHDEAVKRAEDVATLRAIQFTEDASPTAHPIRPESYSEINNFYTPTVYEKGAEVIRMIHAKLGAAGFRAGMDLYFQRHDGQAVTCDDFIAAMADANRCDLSPFTLWYRQAGTPHLTVRRAGVQGRQMQLELAQKLAPTPAATGTAPMPLPIRLGFVGRDGQPLSHAIDGSAMAAEHVVMLSDAKQMIEVEFAGDVPAEQAVPSLLRGFSAPVRLSDDVSAEELGILAAHDSDSFNRYEACQRLAHNILAANLAGGSDTHSEQALIHALRLGLADTTQRDDFKALCLSVPGQADTEQRANPADPPQIFAQRLALQARLGTALADDIMPILQTGDHLDHAAGRSLQNKLLGLACAAGNSDALDIALSQSENLNMSLSMGGLQALNHIQHEHRGTALSRFYGRWQEQALVMEKWLMLSATSASHGTIENIRALMQDKVFDASNPNKLRSVLGAFAAANPAFFHKEDGSGYRFIAEELVTLDKRNPQIAARMGLALTRFANYGPARQKQMREALDFLAGHSLSRDLDEVVSKALKTA